MLLIEVVMPPETPALMTLMTVVDSDRSGPLSTEI